MFYVIETKQRDSLFRQSGVKCCNTCFLRQWRRAFNKLERLPVASFFFLLALESLATSSQLLD